MDKSLAETIGRRAKAARESYGWTQAYVAERVGWITEVYGRMERGQMLPSVESLRRLSWVLNVPAGQFLGMEDQTQMPALAPDVLSGTERRILGVFRALAPREQRLLSQVAQAFRRAQPLPGQQNEGDAPSTG